MKIMRRFQQRCLARLIISMTLFSWCAPGIAAEAPWVKISISPKQTEFMTGTAVFLSTEAGGADLEFTWKVIGPGKIEGTGPAVVYNPPTALDKSAVSITVTVIVRDKSGRQANDTVKFTVIPAKPAAPGMSTTTKIALGVGATAALGAGIALAVAGGDDDDSGGTLPVFGNWSFSGQALADTCDLLSLGLPTEATESLNIQQNGRDLTASHQLGNVLRGNWQFTGRVEDKSFRLSSTSPATETSSSGCTYNMSVEMDAENIKNNAGNGNLRVNVIAVRGCSGSCQTVWTGNWRRTAW